MGKSATVCQVEGITGFYVESLRGVARSGNSQVAALAGARRRALIEAEAAYVLALADAEACVAEHGDL